MAEAALTSALTKLVAPASKNPESFLEVQPKLFEAAKGVTKSLYDTAKSSEAAGEVVGAMPELVIQDFDEEQVWAGVEMQNAAVLDALRSKLARIARRAAEGGEIPDLLTGGNGKETKGRKRKNNDSEDEDSEGGEDGDPEVSFKRVKFQENQEEFASEDEDADDLEDGLDEDDDDDDLGEEEEEEEQGDGEEDEMNDDDSFLNDPDFQHMSDSDGDDLPLFANAKSSDDEDEDESEEEEGKAQEKAAKANAVAAKAESYMADAMKNLRKNAGGRSDPKSEVEDRFFKLGEMEKFLEAEDGREERRRLREEKGMDADEDDLEEDGVDYFAGSDNEGDEAEERAKYGDYFGDGGEGDDAEGEEEDDDDDDVEEQASGRTNLLDDSDSDSDDDEEPGSKKEALSTFEESQARLAEKIRRVEDEAVGEKPWQLTGEIAGPARPENSLLAEHLDFDSVSRAAPAVTEEVSRRLEDIILQRVRDKAWDDVERKVKPVEDPSEYKKRMVLDQEKSKLSLSEVYEQEYLKKKGEAEEAAKVQGLLDPETGNETPKEVEEIKKSMTSLFAKLDALTHHHYTPKNLDAEVRVVRNMPSASVEDVAPAAASDAALLAPQELQEAPRGELAGKEERTDTDRKRERRKKKAKQRAIAKHKEGKDGNKKDKKIKGVESMKDEGKDKSVKSSTAFFSQLQRETEEAVRDKAGKVKKRSKDKGERKTGAQLKL